ncbi:hypothetical protein JRI60_12230 [Archangium violaceum]|uniref:hypothetical protein n=1 Tax=Archangium violaceum TaxID=83451 RepID=UPI00195059C2|nr:hypothetical protein [Archangium violaceum]QRN99732.1 hypothetical protein JRI60_12230 [Archangium violaceum]
MKMTSRLVVSCMSAMALVAAWLPAAASAADGEREATPANVCRAASVAEEPQNEARESSAEQKSEQGSGIGPVSGFCTVDCSQCSTSKDCWSRGAGNCTSIPACVQSEPLATLK